MIDAILVLNAGSSSLKFSVFLDGEPPKPFLRGQLESILTTPRFLAKDGAGHIIGERSWPSPTRLGHEGAVAFLFEWGRGGALAGHRIVAAGHRVVHGGVRHDRPVRIDATILAALDELVALAPLHQPHNLAAIRAITAAVPQLPQVACFDTSFHRTQPGIAQLFALPQRYADEGVRRYGFHGLSYEYIASVLPGIDAGAARGRTVVAHLGNGASMCAMKAGKSVASTMGFTALDGLPMGTRCGALDPGVLLYLMERHGQDARALEKLLYQESGLLGLSGISSDMRTLLASADPRAATAIDVFVYRIGRELGSLAAALGGLDALVFTGGIGENAAAIRARVCRDAAWLGLELDETANNAGWPRISAPGSRVTGLVIPTNEERMIAQHTRSTLYVDAGLNIMA
jgi:acetate kinase